MFLNIPTDNFYGPKTLKQLKIEKVLRNSREQPFIKLPSYLKSLRGPSRTWLVFSKQQDALDFAKIKASGIKSFAFETSSGTRSFLTCHPIVLWFVNSQRPAKDRCTYEIIPDGSACKLYFDLEFDYEFNPAINGNRMIDTLIQIVCWNVKKYFGLDCSTNDVLKLNSCTSHKFSYHLIFQSHGLYFQNNYYAGNFVKSVLKEITDNVDNTCFIEEVGSACSLTADNLKELFITDKKGVIKPFVDCGVYTRNRHFRLLGCTKLHKNAPLLVCSSNKYTPPKNEDYSLFLASLVTYFECDVTKGLIFGRPPNSDIVLYKPSTSLLKIESKDDLLSCSGIDDFITKLVSPHGYIRKKIRRGTEIFYDVLGYRFCGNIGRPHRSNHVRFIVDLNRHTVSQACYDPDCKNYKSPSIALPSQISFTDEDDSLIIEVAENLLEDNDFLELLSCSDFTNFTYHDLGGKSNLLNDFSLNSKNDFEDENKVPDMNVTDEEMLAVADALF